MTDFGELRRQLHAAAELSGREFDTATRITEFLADCQPDELRVGLGGTGVLATFSGRDSGPSVLLRCELDALLISELNSFPHVSAHTGVSHKCGHDGHMAMLCAVASALGERRLDRGTVHLLFQPAEENGTGAAAVLADPGFAAVHADFAIAIHNMPGFETGAVVVKSGPMSPAVRSIAVRFVGRTAHASQPQEGVNPSLAVADLLLAAVGLEVTEPNDPNFRLATAVYTRIGSPAYGVSAGDGEVHFTLRALSDETLAALDSELRALADELAIRDGLAVHVDTVESFAATYNEPVVADLVRQAARDAGLLLVEPSEGMAAGEDFGLLSARFGGCFVLLGAGEDHAPLHSEFYDFPDEVIPVGVRLYEEILSLVGVWDS